MLELVLVPSMLFFKIFFLNKLLYFKISYFLFQPLRVNGVKVYTENVDKRQIILDLQIR
jgi:hypothetical protein